MAGTKRSHGDIEMNDQQSTKSPFMPMFQTFREELDEHHDRRERIIKASRDITALSKKIVRQLQSPVSANVEKENEPRQTQINDLFTSVAPDLQNLNAWRYQRNISGGIQEYMEAVSFQHYLETQHLITYDEAQAKIPSGIYLTEEDYLLGLFDLVGELMRFAITSMATNGVLLRGKGEGKGEGRDILSDLRELRMCFEGLNLKGHTEKKMEVMRTCVEKVEGSVYGMIVRGRERPKGWMPDLEGERREVESY